MNEAKTPDLSELQKKRRNAFLVTLLCVVLALGSWFVYEPVPFFRIVLPIAFILAMLLWARNTIRDHRALKQARS